MKRINRTLTAAVLAGSLTLGGTAVASAQIPAPAEIEIEGVTYQRQADGSYQHRNENGELDGTTKLTAEQAQRAWEQQQAQAADAEAPEEDAPTTTSVMAPDMDMAATGEATAPSSVDYPINGESESEAEPTSTEFDKKQLAWLALPAALIIGGVTWYLAKDGKTYVKSEEEAQKDAPSAEEKAASEKMLQENKDEVIAQGGQLADNTAAQAPAQSRGISAETGSNTVARGLAALAIAAMIAAGAVVARRKLFI